MGFERLGIVCEVDGEDLIVPAKQSLKIQADMGDHVPKLEDQPWPAFPADTMSIAIVTATQCQGLIMMHEKMFESRLFFVDKLIGMGAKIVLCDPHRALVAGPSRLRGATLDSPDIRAGMALLIAALCAEGRSVINNVGQIERGYERIDYRLTTARRIGRASGRQAQMTTAVSIPREEVAELAGFGIRAFTTTRDAGTFSLSGPDPVGEVMTRWTRLQEELSPYARRTVIGRQVHGSTVITHRGGWEGLLRTGEADGHLAAERGNRPHGVDCRLRSDLHCARQRDSCAAPFGLARNGRAASSTPGIKSFGRLGIAPDELTVHLGPSICGRCYEVSAEVREQLTGQPANRRRERGPSLTDRGARSGTWSDANQRECGLHQVRQRPLLLAPRWRHRSSDRCNCGRNSLNS